MIKRKKLWQVDNVNEKEKDKYYGNFLQFLDNTLNFLSVRENEELFRNMNGFYNVVLKEKYIMSLDHKKEILKQQLSHISSIKNGRVEALVKMNSSPFNKLSEGVLSNLVIFFSFKEGFSKFRQVNRKFFRTFETHMSQVFFEIPKMLKDYSEKAITECKTEIDNNLTIVARINKMGTTLRAQNSNANHIFEKKCIQAIKMIQDPVRYSNIRFSDFGEPQFDSSARF